MPSLVNVWRRCVLTVCGETKRRSPTSRLRRPSVNETNDVELRGGQRSPAGSLWCGASRRRRTPSARKRACTRPASREAPSVRSRARVRRSAVRSRLLLIELDETLPSSSSVEASAAWRGPVGSGRRPRRGAQAVIGRKSRERARQFRRSSRRSDCAQSELLSRRHRRVGQLMIADGSRDADDARLRR